MITHSIPITQGLVSGGSVEVVMDLGQHAYADTFVREDQLHLSEPVFPLQVALDRNTGHLQLAYVSSAQDRYNLYAYSYTSSNSAASRRHWDGFAEDIASRHNTKGLVVEIGSNDGYLLSRFQEQGRRVLGIDSSEIIADIAIARDVPTVKAVFDRSVADTVKAQYGESDLVIANNVFNHANDPVAFAQAVERLLAPGGIFVFEVPYWLEMMRADRFPDMIYHEHVSYFTVRGTWNLLKRAGLEMQSYSVVDYHGGSLRVVAQRDQGSAASPAINQAMHQETDFGLFDRDFYHGVMGRLHNQRNRWLRDFYQLRIEDPTACVIGVGAAAKANTWLTWHGLNRNVIQAVTDASEFKQGKYTPLTRIPIRGDQEFACHEHPYALVLSWNIGDTLRQALLKINPNTRFITQ
jgi:SAM-dependent methyltransferase